MWNLICALVLAVSLHPRAVDSFQSAFIVPRFIRNSGCFAPASAHATRSTLIETKSTSPEKYASSCYKHPSIVSNSLFAKSTPLRDSVIAKAQASGEHQRPRKPLFQQLTRFLRTLFRKPFVKLYKALLRIVQHKSRIQQDVEDKLHMLTDEEVVQTSNSNPLSYTKVEAMEPDVVVLEELQPKPVVGKLWRLSDQWPIASVDLSGNWSMMITDDFRKEYDEYLKQLGQPLIVRSVALGIVGMTTEETIQANGGRNLTIKGRNARGVWERTLVTTNDDNNRNNEFVPVTTTIITADSEEVSSQSWWEQKGTVHKSWLRGGTKYGGGDFESKRYLENNGQVLVCESVFYPNDKSREQARVTWRFQRT